MTAAVVVLAALLALVAIVAIFVLERVLSGARTERGALLEELREVRTLSGEQRAGEWREFLLHQRASDEARLTHLRESEAEARLERERLTRALLAKNLPELGAMTRIVEGDRAAEQRAEAVERVRSMRAGLVPDEADPTWPADTPRVPEGMSG